LTAATVAADSAPAPTTWAADLMGGRHLASCSCQGIKNRAAMPAAPIEARMAVSIPGRPVRAAMEYALEPTTHPTVPLAPARIAWCVVDRGMSDGPNDVVAAAPLRAAPAHTSGLRQM